MNCKEKITEKITEKIKFWSNPQTLTFETATKAKRELKFYQMVKSMNENDLLKIESLELQLTELKRKVKVASIRFDPPTLNNPLELTTKEIQDLKTYKSEFEKTYNYTSLKRQTKSLTKIIKFIVDTEKNLTII